MGDASNLFEIIKINSIPVYMPTWIDLGNFERTAENSGVFRLNNATVTFWAAWNK